MPLGEICGKMDPFSQSLVCLDYCTLTKNYPLVHLITTMVDNSRANADIIRANPLFRLLVGGVVGKSLYLSFFLPHSFQQTALKRQFAQIISALAPISSIMESPLILRNWVTHIFLESSTQCGGSPKNRF